MTDTEKGNASSLTSSRKLLLKSAGVITIFTVLSRILGLVREQVRSYYLGTGMGSDAFGLAATIPNLFRRLLAEGAMTAAFVPVFSGYLEKEKRAELASFLSSFLTLFTFITTLVCVLGILFADVVIDSFFSAGFGEVEGKLALTIVLTRIMFPYLLLVSLAAIVQAVLNSLNIFSPSAFTPVLLNLCVIGVVAAFHDSFADQSYAFAAGFLVGGLLQLLFQLPWFFRQGIRLRFSINWKHPGVREMFRIFLPGALAAGIYQVNVFVSQMIAASLYPGSIASLQYSVRLQELVLGVFVISMTTVILPTMARQHAGGRREAFEDTNYFSLQVLALVTVPATVALLVLRRPVVSLLFQQGAFDEHSTDLTSAAVLYHCLGIYFIAAYRSLNQAFFAMKDLKTPMYISAVAMVVNVAGCYGLSAFLGHAGIALANSLSAVASAVLLYILLGRRGVKLRALSQGRFLAALLLAGGAMAGVIAAWLEFVSPTLGTGKSGHLLTIVGSGLAGLCVFALVSYLLAGKEVRDIVQPILRRRGRGKGNHGDKEG